MSAAIFLIPIVTAVVLVVIYGLEMYANNERIKRGEEPVKHHDLTDYPGPIDVIDWTKQ